MRTQYATWKNAWIEHSTEMKWMCNDVILSYVAAGTVQGPRGMHATFTGPEPAEPNGAPKQGSSVPHVHHTETAELDERGSEGQGHATVQ